MPEGTQTIFLAGGGTGGHLYPGLAVAEALQSRCPEVRPVFLCTEREIDRVILEKTGFEIIPQPIVPPVRTISGLVNFWKSWRETKDLVKRLLRERRPAAVLGLGGYAAGVAVKVAALRKIPTAILNPDTVPGKANQYLMRYARAVCCQFEATIPYVPADQRSKLRFTGCPIRRDIAQLPPRGEAMKRLGLDRLLSTLVITGASLGAQTVNEGVLAMLEGMNLQGWQILHLAGRDHAAAVRAGYRALPEELNVVHHVIDFTPEMADVWAAADLAICRSGASTCAELTACGVASILMPYPYHKDMHQRANAKVLVDAGAAVLVDDQKDARKNAAKLRPLIESLLVDAPRRAKMAMAAKELGRRDAADAVTSVLLQLAHPEKSPAKTE